jgi:hypothetical protein
MSPRAEVMCKSEKPTMLYFINAVPGYGWEMSHRCMRRAVRSRLAHNLASAAFTCIYEQTNQRVVVHIYRQKCQGGFDNVPLM